MPETVWINGAFVERDEARVSAFDAGLQHAVGLFETMLACGPDGRIFRIEKHLARLDRSARELGLTDSLKVRALAETLEHVVAQSGLTGEDPALRARVRLTVTGGNLSLLGSSGQGPVDPTVMIHVQPSASYPEEMFDRGVGVVIADTKANPLNPFEGHKTLHYWWRLHELQAASTKGASEAIVLGVTNHVASGCVSNLFAVSDGVLRTPIAHSEEEPGALHAPVLPGVTRGAIIESADALGVGCAREMMAIDAVLDADEVFLTNSSWGVLPVVRVESKVIGEGTPGELTQRLRERWLEMTREEP